MRVKRNCVCLAVKRHFRSFPKGCWIGPTSAHTHTHTHTHWQKGTALISHPNIVWRVLQSLSFPSYLGGFSPLLISRKANVILRFSIQASLFHGFRSWCTRWFCSHFRFSSGVDGTTADWTRSGPNRFRWSHFLCLCLHFFSLLKSPPFLFFFSFFNHCLRVCNLKMAFSQSNLID